MGTLSRASYLLETHHIMSLSEGEGWLGISSKPSSSSTSTPSIPKSLSNTTSASASAPVPTPTPEPTSKSVGPPPASLQSLDVRRIELNRSLEYE